MKNFQFEKFEKLWLENSKHVPNIPISKNIKFFELLHFEIKKQILTILQFGKLSTFHKFTILWIIMYFEFSNNFKKYQNKKKFE